jgi:hypothetical protein
MTESSLRQLRPALIWFMTAASGAGLLLWAIVGSFHASVEGYFNLYGGYAIVLFVPALFAGMVAALGAMGAMKLASQHSLLPDSAWAGLGTFGAYGVTAHVAMWMLTQGAFLIWVPLLSAVVLGIVAATTVHRVRRHESPRSHRGPAERPVIVGEGRDA